MPTSKSYKSVVRVTDKGAVHGVRLLQVEYKSRKRARVQVAETFCGRKAERGNSPAKRGNVTCQACIKAMAAKANRK